MNIERIHHKITHMELRKIFALGAAAIGLIILVALAGWIFENVDADQIVVIQDPIDGELHWHTNAGVKLQMFGKVTKYLKRDIYEIQDVRVRFNDAGHGTIRGSIQYDMPMDVDNLNKLHTRYGTPVAIKDQVIKRTVDKVIYMIGPLMSSRESYAEKRTDLINYVQDQVDRGVYRVAQRTQRETDAISGQEKTTVVAEILRDAAGIPLRQEGSIVGEFGIRAFNFAIQELKYAETVEAQIQQQQQITMDVQTGIAEVRKAEQRKLTVEQQGQAEAAKAKWEQEVIKAREVTAAEQRREVARLNADAAELTKREQTLLGEGEAARKRLVMNADGALEKKLETYEKVQAYWADAFGKHQGPLVPSVVMGGTAGSGSAGATTQTLIELLGAKAAKDLALDMRVQSGVNVPAPVAAPPTAAARR